MQHATFPSEYYEDGLTCYFTDMLNVMSKSSTMLHHNILKPAFKSLPINTAALVFETFSSKYTAYVDGAVAQRVERWTCDQQVVGSNLARGKRSGDAGLVESNGSLPPGG